MDLRIPYAKTDLAWSVIRERSAELDAAMRALLIMMDGKRPLMDLVPAIKALSLKIEDVHVLLTRGLVRPCETPAARAAVSAPPPAAQATPVVAPPQAPAPSSNRSLAAAKFYALDQLARLLGRGDEALRLAARQVIDHASLMTWLESCRDHIEQVAGPDRAELFAARTLELLPEAQSAFA